jgi:hypothetical protein
MTDRETFLSRWSRLKHEAASAPAAAAEPALPVEAEPAQELPPVESLDFSSDFSRFLRSKAEEGVKRAALKKLFHSPHFNQMDGLDVYIDDYNVFEPIPEEMLQNLAHAREMLFGPAEVAEPGPALAQEDEGDNLPAGVAQVSAPDRQELSEPQPDPLRAGDAAVAADRA